jgi:PKD repeat protein
MNPSHTYLSPCDCTVRLTVTGPGGSDFIEHPVTVSVLPSLIQPAKVAAW